MNEPIRPNWLYVLLREHPALPASLKEPFTWVLVADGSAAKSALLLGTTGQFLFLYDAETRSVDIHPHENVQTISFIAPER